MDLRVWARRPGVVALAAAALLALAAAPSAAQSGTPRRTGARRAARPAASSDNPRAEMTIEGRGKVLIELLSRDAPKTVAHIEDLISRKFYDGIRFHRVRPGFMAQVGDPNSRSVAAAQMAGKSDDELAAMGLGVGGSGKSVPLEVATGRTHERGTLGMARSSDPNSGDSQFFINFAPNHRLDGGYTVFGKVAKGMDVVDRIKQGDRISSFRLVKKGSSGRARR